MIVGIENTFGNSLNVHEFAKTMAIRAFYQNDIYVPQLRPHPCVCFGNASVELSPHRSKPP
jgi:hypothetical protein